MTDKAPLALLEQILMLLIFALAAVLCLQAFLRSDTASREIALRDEAMLCTQSAAEVVKACRGDLHDAAAILGGTVEGSVWRAEYERMTLTATVEVSSGYLGQAQLTATSGGRTLLTLPVAWQEVTP